MGYQGKTYYYEKNLQGDIIGLFDDGKNSVVQYQYDSWGKLLNTTGTLSSTVGTINPLRYRGYYNDVETGFFYVGSRYYDAGTCRFLNADDPSILGLTGGTVLGANLFTYGDNNPVMNIDPTGYLSVKNAAKLLCASYVFTMFMALLYANYTYGLAVVGEYVLAFISPKVILAYWWNLALAAGIIIAAVAIVVAAVGICYAKAAKESAKARATNCPSWLGSSMNAKPPKWGEKAQAYAKRLLDDKYGAGNWKEGPGKEYNQIVKYLQRNLGMK